MAASRDVMRDVSIVLVPSLHLLEDCGDSSAGCVEGSGRHRVWSGWSRHCRLGASLYSRQHEKFGRRPYSLVASADLCST